MIPGPAGQITVAAIADAKAKLVAKYGAHAPTSSAASIRSRRCGATSDGDLAAFCLEQFVAEPKARDELFARLQAMSEQIRAHPRDRPRRALEQRGRHRADAPVEPLLAAYDPARTSIEDMFTSKVAFAALLNFPLTTLADRIRDGAQLHRAAQWAEVRLTRKFDTRVPGELLQAASAAEAAADQYIAGYNIWMHHVLAEDGKRLFPRAST